MTSKNVVILVLIVAISSAGITRYAFPQIQLKEVQVEHDVIKNNIQTIIKTIVKPDGTKEIDETINDTSTNTQTKKQTIQENKQPQWMFDVGARTNFTDREIVYDIQAQRRILGPFYLGAKLSTDHSVGLSIGMEF